MNKNRAEAKALITELLPLVKEAGCEVVLCTPYTNLETALAPTEGTNVKVGAENCHWAESGAFAGEILRTDAEGAGRAVCYHRAQRAPAVFRRDR